MSAPPVIRTSPPRRRRRSSPVEWVLLAVAAAALLAAGAYLLRPDLFRSMVDAGDPVKRAVLSHMDGTVNDPDYQVMGWEGPTAVTDRTRVSFYRQVRAQDAERLRPIVVGGTRPPARDPESLASPIRYPFLHPIASAPPGSAVNVDTVRFRATNGFGAKIIVDRAFAVVNGEVVLFRSPEDLGRGATRFLAAVLPAD